MVADALSRHTEKPTSVASLELQSHEIDFDVLAAAQAGLQDELMDSSLKLEAVPWRGTRVLCDTSTGTFRPVVPVSFRRQIFNALHGLSHPGPRPSQRLISARYVWPGMKKDVNAWCKSCHPCQAAKVARHVSAPVTRFEPAERRFGSIHINLVGPLPPSEGF